MGWDMTDRGLNGRVSTSVRVTCFVFITNAYGMALESNQPFVTLNQFTGKLAKVKSITLTRQPKSIANVRNAWNCTRIPLHIITRCSF
jgi:hypothetical protein